MPPPEVKFAHLKYSPAERAALEAESSPLYRPRFAMAKERVRGALAAAAESLPGPAPTPALER